MDNRPLGLGGACGSSFGESGVRKRLGAIASLVELSGDRLLDLGCANGVYTTELAEAFERVDAIDVEPQRLNDFRAAIVGTPLAQKIHIRQMSGAAMDFADGVFDAVTTIEVLEHVADLDGTISEVHRVLRPGGLFCVTSPNRWFPFETHGVLIRGRRVSPAKVPFVTWVPPVHRRVADARVFTRRSLRHVVEKRGFRLVGGTYIMPPFDRSRLGHRLRPWTDRLERTPLRVVGMAHVLAFAKS